MSAWIAWGLRSSRPPPASVKSSTAHDHRNDTDIFSAPRRKGIFRHPEEPVETSNGSNSMKSILLAVFAAFTASACVTSGPATAWGKEGVSMLDYRTDGGQCAVIAATQPSDSNGDHAAGGLSGKNETTRLPQAGSGDSTASSGATGSAFPTGGGGMYRDNTNVDTVARAANQSQ